MPRPRKCRMVRGQPRAGYYKPQGIPLAGLQEVILPVEGLEALRLVDLEGLEQEAAAGLMGISRPTFSRLLSQARQQVSQALVNGWALRIQGGDYRLTAQEGPPGPDGGRRGRGRGRHGWRRGG